MEISIYRANNNLYVDIMGRIVLDVCEQFKNSALPLIDKGINQVYIDLSGVDFIDSAGLGVLVGLKMTSNKNKARLVLVSPSDGVNDILYVSKLDSIFDIITGSEAEILKRTFARKEYLIKEISEEEHLPRKMAPSPAGGDEESATPKVAPIPASSEQPAKVAVEAEPIVEPAPVSVPPAGKSTAEQVDEYCRKAVELMRQGDYEKAIEKYLDALKLDPDYVPAYNNLAIVYEKKPSWRTKAIETWEKVLQLSQAMGDQKHIDRAQKHLSKLETSF